MGRWTQLRSWLHRRALVALDLNSLINHRYLLCIHSLVLQAVVGRGSRGGAPQALGNTGSPFSLVIFTTSQTGTVKGQPCWVKLSHAHAHPHRHSTHTHAHPHRHSTHTHARTHRHSTHTHTHARTHTQCAFSVLTMLMQGILLAILAKHKTHTCTHIQYMHSFIIFSQMAGSCSSRSDVH